MTNVYDNAGHLERLGALARENEDLKRRLAELEKQQPVNARLLGVAHQVVGLIANTSIQAGYCCCGDGMDGHASPMLCGHPATDQGEYLASLLYKEAQSAIASAEAQQAEPVHDLLSVSHRLALELECLLLDTKDMAAVSRWWDSANEALDAWRSVRDSIAAAAEAQQAGPNTGHADMVNRAFQDGINSGYAQAMMDEMARHRQAEPALPANKTHGDSHAWLAWALHIIRERCPDVLTSHQYDCASKALAAWLCRVEGANPQAEPVPVEAIGRLLTEAMDKAVENGASSVSMPDDYVAVAAWLCRVEGADNG